MANRGVLEPFHQVRAATGAGRREFIALLGGAAVAWPNAGRAQQTEQARRIAVLMYWAESDPEARARVAALRTGLEESGWSEGRNLHVEYRFADYQTDRARAFAKELVAMHPEVIFASTSAVLAVLMSETRTTPIVFAGGAEPTELASMARPGGNVTGFTNSEFSLGGKWLELLKEIAPAVARVAFMFKPETNPSARFFLQSGQAAAPSVGVELVPVPVHDVDEIESAIDAFAREPNGGLVVPPDLFLYTAANRRLLIDLAARHHLPTVHFDARFARDGGLMSYGADVVEPYRHAASYIDRILKGARPGDLPIQAPTKFDLSINLKTAKALGLAVPPSILGRADEVIE